MKSRGGVAASVRYVGRNRAEDHEAAKKDRERPGDGLELDAQLAKKSDLPMWNERGKEFRGEGIDRQLRSWQLKTDANNLSNTASKADPAELAAMSNNERLNQRQALHLIFSLPVQKGDLRDTTRKFKEALNGGLAETLGRQGHRYLYTIHTDRKNVHAHILVKARRETAGATRSKQLRWNCEDGIAVKEILTEKAREQGLEIETSRRVDRERPTQARRKNWYQAKTGKVDWSHHVQEAAPVWTATNGAAWEQRRMTRSDGQAATGKAGAQLDTSTAPAFVDFFNKSFRDPQAAAKSFTEFFQEAPRLAAWAIIKQPEMFGEKIATAEPKFRAAEVLADISGAEGHPLRENATQALKNAPDLAQVASDLGKDLKASRDIEQLTRDTAEAIGAGRIKPAQVKRWADKIGSEAESVLRDFKKNPEKAEKAATAIAGRLAQSNARSSSQLKALRSIAGKHAGPANAGFIRDRADQVLSLREFERGLGVMSRNHRAGTLTPEAVNKWASEQRQKGRALDVAANWTRKGGDVFAEAAKGVGGEIKKLYAQKIDAERRISEGSIPATRRRRTEAEKQRAHMDPRFVAKSHEALKADLGKSENPAHQEAAKNIPTAAPETTKAAEATRNAEAMKAILEKRATEQTRVNFLSRILRRER